MNNVTWHDIKVRQPTEADMRDGKVYCAWSDGTYAVYILREIKSLIDGDGDGDVIIAWTSDFPIYTPPKPKTRSELDDEAYHTWAKIQYPEYSHIDVWRAACVYRDSLDL